MKWSSASINELLSTFPNALDVNHKVPSGKDISAFLRNAKDPTLKKRHEAAVRVWFHNMRRKNAGKQYTPEWNHIPTNIYLKFKDYINSGKLPSHNTCSKFIGKSPSKSNITITNIRDWVNMAIKRRST